LLYAKMLPTAWLFFESNFMEIWGLVDYVGLDVISKVLILPCGDFKRLTK
jgi:hypothetical protein